VRPLLLLAPLAALACGGAEPGPSEGAPATVVRPADVAPPAAAPEHLGLGRAPTAEEIAAWDIDVDPRGHGLPPGQGSVAEGKALYTSKACSACHGLQGEGGVGPQLVGREPTTGFGEDWHLPRTIGNYWPYATTIYDYVHRAMPQTQPGSLTPDETYALTAYLLAANGIVGDDFVADAKTLPAVKMPTKVEFVRDDRESTPAFR
jgi:cytochrome c